MKKKVNYLLAIAVGILLAFCGLVGCAKAAPGGGKPGGTPGETPGGEDNGRYASVVASTISVTETDSIFMVSWGRVPDASSYTLVCGESTVTVNSAAVNLRKAEYEFKFPANGILEMTITAKGYYKKDSEPTKFTYKVEGALLRSPVITKYENGILEWEADGNAVDYTVKVDGAAVFRADSKSVKYDTKNDVGAHSVEIVANGDGIYFKSASTAVNINEKHTALCLAPVTEYKVENGTLSWSPVGGVEKYLVVDLDRSATLVTETSYEMEGVLGYKNIVYGVYPVSDNPLVRDAEITAVDIPYLRGKGTASEPYLITTPFELRAVDYYESLYAEALAAFNAGKIKTAPAKNNYRIENDLDYAAVAAGDEESNIFTLAKPFYGTLDGNGKTVKGMRVCYDGGYWALFDYLVAGSVVKDITFDEPTIDNAVQDETHPINASVATVAYYNYGTVSGITVKNAAYTSAGGEISGIVSHNYGVIEKCTVSGTFKLKVTGLDSQACYETAGIATENCGGGTVKNNSVKNLTIDGDFAQSPIYKLDSNGNVVYVDGKPVIERYSYYNNARTVAGIVAVNRKGGTVSDNGVSGLKMTNMLNSYSADGGFEFGGVVAYNAGAVVKGTATVDSYVWSTSTKDGVKVSPITDTVTQDVGTASDLRGKYVGKNDGTFN